MLISCYSMNYKFITGFTPINYILDPLLKPCEVLILKGLRVFVLCNIPINQNKIRLKYC